MPPKPEKLDGTVNKELHVFYVLDTSGSMIGAPVGALNDAMRATVEELKKKDGEKADFHIAALEFNTNTRWVTKGNNGLEALADFIWTDVQATGMTYLGKALRELNTCMSRNAMMKAATGNKIPVVIFMSDGYPNDPDGWENGLQELAQNKWFRHAIKVAFALGDDADVDALAKVVGVREDGSIVPCYEAVIKTNDLKTFADMIQAVSVTASLSASSSVLTSTAKSGKDIVQEVTGNNTTTVDPNGKPGPVVIDPAGDPDIYGGSDGFDDDDEFGSVL